jgi:predicted ATP-grasp superfamily ATP-dependent carboligase
MVERRVVIAGVTTRALATSAARSGWQVTAVDGFGDLDLRAVATQVVVQRSGGQGYTAELVRTLRANYVAYTSNLENYPESVALLMNGRTLLGNPPEVLARVRDPIGLMRTLRQRGWVTPNTRATAPSRGARPGEWLLKPRRSGGGHGTRIWRRGQVIPRAHYLQQRIEGVPGSIVFVADGVRAMPLGISRQLVGERRLGARGFRYCGSLLSTDRACPLFPQHERVEEAARALAGAATTEFNLVGLNGIDFIAQHAVPYPIEINPRYSASMELVERALGIPLFELHANGCEGKLPGRIPVTSSRARIAGKAVVFARRDVTVGDTQAWLLLDTIADVPRAGERITRGHPISTVFGEAGSVEACRRMLLRRADWVYRSVEPRARGAA